MSELGLSIKIGAVVGGALAALGSVQGHMERMGTATVALRARQKRLNQVIERFASATTSARLGRLQMQYDRVGAAIKRVERAQERLNRVAQKGAYLRQQRQNLQGEVLNTLAIGAVVAAPIKLAVDFESAMADVKKVVDFESPEGFKKLGDDLLALTQRIPMTGDELAQITASGGQLGVAKKDLLGFTEQVAMMATAFDMSAGDAGEAMAKLANVYQIPILEIGKLGDAINELSNNSPAKANEIVRALGRVGGVAKQFGLTEIEATALSSAFIALGKPPEVAARSINGMLTKLGTADKQGKKFQAALGAMGLSAGGLKQAIAKDAQGAVVDFLGALKKVPAQQRMGILVDLFGLEYADDVAVLAGSVQTYTDQIAILKKGFDGSMGKEFEARAATTGNNLQLLKNSATQLGITIGSTVLPSLNELVNSVKPVVVAFANWAKANPTLLGYLVKGLAIFAAAKVALLGLGFVTNTFSSAWLSALKVWVKGGAALAWLRAGWVLKGPVILAKLGAGLDVVGKGVLWLGRALMLNPIGLAITGIALGAYLIYKYWEPIASWFKGLWQEVKSAFGGGLSGIGKLLVNWSPLGLFYKAFAGVLSWLGVDLPAKFTDFGGLLVDGLVGGIVKAFGSAKDAVLSLGTGIKDWFAQTLGIRSPSRVFKGFGVNIGEGAHIGMLSQLGRVQGTARRLAGVAAAGAALAGAGAGATSSAHAGNITVHFAPTIQLQSGGDSRDQVHRALQLSVDQLEQMLRRVQADRARRAY